MMNQDQPPSDAQHPDSSSNPENTEAKPDQIEQNQTEQQQSKPEKPKNKGLLKVIVAIVVLLLLGLIAYGLWKAYQPKQVQVQGRVEAETLHISTKVPSRIEQVYVSEGQKVKK